MSARPRSSCFDDRADPGEHNDIAGGQPQIVSRLSGVLESWQKANEPLPAERAAEWREIAARGAPSLTIDEVTTGAHLQLTGTGWNMADQKDNYLGGCFWTEPARRGETASTATWRGDNPMLGRYRVSIWYGALPPGGVATDAPFTVQEAERNRFVSTRRKRSGNGRSWESSKIPCE
jgi:hypothetical protein